MHVVGHVTFRTSHTRAGKTAASGAVYSNRAFQPRRMQMARPTTATMTMPIPERIDRGEAADEPEPVAPAEGTVVICEQQRREPEGE